MVVGPPREAQRFTRLVSMLLLSEPVQFVKKLEDVCHELGRPLRCTSTGSQRVCSSGLRTSTTSKPPVPRAFWRSSTVAEKKLMEDTLSNAEGTDTCHVHVSIGNPLLTSCAVMVHLAVFRVGWSCFQSSGDQVFSLGSDRSLHVCSLCVAAGFISSLCRRSVFPVKAQWPGEEYSHFQPFSHFLTWPDFLHFLSCQQNTKSLQTSQRNPTSPWWILWVRP